jgi:glycogen debranching enzyme
MRGLLPALNNALHWLWTYGDIDKDGFIEYRTDAAQGLRNQGWKDSTDSIMHADGRRCEGPIALAEVQGYVYLAYTRLVPVMKALGENDRAAELERRAVSLKRGFNRRFWLSSVDRLAMAIDGDGEPADVMSSNAGQALWSGMLSRRRARSVRDALFGTDMFTGWGIRTLSSSSPNYYPLGYHVGTVWPHDNGIIALGLKRYGFEHEANELATALFEAACRFTGFRLPEAFGGQARSEFQPPVPYPVACRPQAWTAGTMLHLLQAMLGLYPDAARGRLYLVRPTLPYWLNKLDLVGLPIGDGLVDLHFESNKSGRTRVRFETRGEVSVEVTRNWRRWSVENP